MTDDNKWGMGSVLRDAGGSTGQSESGRRWPELTKLVAARYRASLNGPNSQDSLDSQDSPTGEADHD